MADKFGPFASIVAIGMALIAVFATLVARMVGSSKQLGWLTGSETPPMLIALGPRMAAVGLMAAVYLFITASNYKWFAALAVMIGIFGFVAATRFDFMRKKHVVDIPVVGKNGQQKVDKKGNLITRSVIVGSEADMFPEAQDALAEARKAKRGVSLVQFMSGYGAEGKVNDPQAIWDRELLATISNRVAIWLMYIILAAVLVIFIAATAIDISQRKTSTPPATTPTPNITSML